jgi:subtilisin family serine protease
MHSEEEVMTHVSRVGVLVCILVAVTLVITPFGAAPGADEADGRYIVMYEEGTCLTCEELALTALKASPLGSSLGIKVTQVLTLINALAIEIPPGVVALVLGLLDPLNSNPLNVINDHVLEVIDDVQTFIDPICPTGALPSDRKEYRWGMGQIKAEEAHKTLGPNPSLPGVVKVAVLDTGIAASHQELNGRIVQGYNAIDPKLQPSDDHGHGTHMAGIILANKNNVGVVGVAGVGPEAPKIKVAPVKVLNKFGAGYLSVVIDGLQWVKDQYDIDPGIRWVVNMSFGFSRDIDDTPLMQAILSLPNDIIKVASAGNACCAGGACDDGGGEDCATNQRCTQSTKAAITYPAAYAGVLAVGATGIDGEAAYYSLSQGQGLDVMAPGGERHDEEPDNGQILSTNNDGLYGQGRGTSQAAAHVTGAVALAWSLDPTLSPQAVRNLVKRNTVLNVQDMINALPQ